MNYKNFSVRYITFSAIFTVLIIVGAFIKIPIPVVPFTLQFLFTTLAGLFLGPRLGFISVCTYILLGLLGLPVFASGGGIGYILNPSFGYLIGFAVGAFVTGFIAQKSVNPSYKRLFVACFCGLIIVYSFGMVYYWIISTFYIKTSIGLWTLFFYCFILAVPGDIAICILSVIIGKRVIPIINKYLEVSI